MSDVCGNVSEKTNINCPICKANAIVVQRVTVENMVKEEFLPLISTQSFFTCLSSECDVIYFDSNSTIFKKDMLRVPVWFKEKSSPKIICYCKDVTDVTISHHVRELGHISLDSIQRYTGANTGKECLIKNPIGR